jgi:hypothetical protein
VVVSGCGHRYGGRSRGSDDRARGLRSRLGPLFDLSCQGVSEGVRLRRRSAFRGWAGGEWLPRLKNVSTGFLLGYGTDRSDQSKSDRSHARTREAFVKIVKNQNLVRTVVPRFPPQGASVPPDTDASVPRFPLAGAWVPPMKCLGSPWLVLGFPPRGASVPPVLRVWCLGSPSSQQAGSCAKHGRKPLA